MDETTNNSSATSSSAEAFDAGALAENLLTEPPAQQEESAEQAQESNPQADARTLAMDALKTLVEDGWTAEELMAFSSDEKAREDVTKNGKTVRQAARAYEKRLREGGGDKGAKRGVPTVKSASGAGASGHDRIAEMSDREFDEFFAKSMSDAMSGKKIRL